MFGSPVAGTHYSAHYDDFMAWFATDEACVDYLEWLRWPDAFQRPECESVSAYRLADGRFECWECKKRLSVTAHTIFDRTRTPLTVWFSAAWSFTAQKDWVSALALAVIEDASHQSLRCFLQDHVELGSLVITDGWSAYPLACGDLYKHEAHVASGAEGGKELPALHQVAGLLKKWLNGTHQGSFGDEHLPEYLEFEFRFNRRHSGSPGLLFYRLMRLAIATEPLRYAKCIKVKRAKVPNKPAPPATRGRPNSLEKTQAARGRAARCRACHRGRPDRRSPCRGATASRPAGRPRAARGVS